MDDYDYEQYDVADGDDQMDDNFIEMENKFCEAEDKLREG